MEDKERRKRVKSKEQRDSHNFALLTFHSSLTVYPRPWRRSLPGVALVHLPSSKVTSPLTMIQR